MAQLTFANLCTAAPNPPLKRLLEGRHRRKESAVQFCLLHCNRCEGKRRTEARRQRSAIGAAPRRLWRSKSAGVVAGLSLRAAHPHGILNAQ